MNSWLSMRLSITCHLGGLFLCPSAIRPRWKGLFSSYFGYQSTNIIAFCVLTIYNTNCPRKIFIYAESTLIREDYSDCLEMQNILFFLTIYSVWSQQCFQLSFIWAHNVIYTTIREISFTPMPILQYSTILHFYSSILVLGGMQSIFFHPSERGLHANLAIKR